MQTILVKHQGTPSGVVHIGNTHSDILNWRISFVFKKNRIWIDLICPHRLSNAFFRNQEFFHNEVEHSHIKISNFWW